MTATDLQTPGVKRRIVLTDRVKRRVDTTQLAQVLGAATVVDTSDKPDTPLGFVAVRQKLLADLVSTGGRPAFQDAERRKIPVPQAIWEIVADAAKQMAEPGFRPSAAQVASAYLSIAVRQMGPILRDDARRVLKSMRTPRKKRVGA